MNHGLITIGGFNTCDKYLASVEINEDKKEWKYLSSMKYKRHNCSSTTIQNYLYVFGGWNCEDGYIDSNEILNLNVSNNNNNNNNLKWTNLNKMINEKQS